MEKQGISVDYSGPSIHAPQWDPYELNNDGDRFIQSLLLSPGTDILDYPNDNCNPIGASEFANECDAERHRRQKNNLASRKSRAVKKERFAAMTEEIEQLQEENDHLRNVVQEMDSAIYKAQSMVMQANQSYH